MFRPLDDTKLAYCLYRSVARPELDRDSIAAILDKARQRNRQQGITGCLHFENGIFFQWVEGPWRRIFQLVEALRDDHRHMDITILDQAPLDQRLFQDWDMRFSDPEAASLFDWRSKSVDQADYAERVRAFLRTVDAR